MIKKHNPQINIIKMLWKRKLFYVMGYIIGLSIGLFCKLLGTKVSKSELIIIPFSASFVFGLLLYLFIKEPERAKREGRMIIFTKEGLIHLGLCFGSIFILGIVFKALNLD